MSSSFIEESFPYQALVPKNSACGAPILEVNNIIKIQLSTVDG